MARVGAVLGASMMTRPSQQQAQAQGEAARDSALAGDQGALQELILGCNRTGMEHLKNGNSDSALEQFKYAEAMLLAYQNDEGSLPLLAVTCNNLGCYYKNIGKFHGSLSYLRRALKMEVELQADAVALAGTHLNISTVLSKLDKHKKAMQHGLCALELMSKRITETQADPTGDDYAVLSIAYHRVAQEREHFEQWDQAATCFQTGYQAASRLLGDSHPLAIALGQNCEAVLKKAKAAAKDKRKDSQRTRVGQDDVASDDDEVEVQAPNALAGLPQIAEAGRDEGESLPMGKERIRSEAADWIRSEEEVWTSFAKKMLAEPEQQQHLQAPLPGLEETAASLDGVGPEKTSVQTVGSGTNGTETARQPSLASMAVAGPENWMFVNTTPRAMVALKELHHTHQCMEMPKAYDMGVFRFAEAPASRSLKRTPLGQALEEHPEALMDIIDADGDSKTSVRTAANDFRPNRSMKRSSRTSRLVRRTGVFNSTQHRDRVMQNLQNQRKTRNGQFSSLAAQTLAAERIQTVWRSWYQYCQQNSEWMTITWICATMIQSHWRSYHVRRKRLDAYAMIIQRHVRGALVRSVLRKHTAAVTIQRRVVGMITRMKLRRLHIAATHMQRITRGGLTRKMFRELRRWRLSVIIAIQQSLRMWLAKRRIKSLMETRRNYQVMVKAVVDMQRFFRGWKGRQRADLLRREREQQNKCYRAAMAIQLLSRARKARRQVNALREERLAEMDKAATYMRKLWIGQRTRKGYQQLRADYKAAVVHIVTIQRYIRGCMCRLRMWREAVRAETEIWAASSIQRVWRGYLGRIRWEDAYEDMWRREVSAAKLQPWLRGWLARVRVSRAKRKIARAEFERAQLRFRAARRVQALVRGVQCRTVQAQRRRRAIAAAVEIQRYARGGGLRRRIWAQVREQRAILIQTAVRRFLVRNRRHHVLAKVIYLQRSYRRWRQLPGMYRKLRHDRVVERRNAAKLIQQRFRDYSMRSRVQRIRAGGGDPMDGGS
eukprot:TRINITY_DN16711_c0_g2_i1.p1 TRINITY_DN16711_c0_g2~~TRINITY_DN16711_c0_g2_i1.p1  ORF type:complete len:1040 (+),score=204.75 TRINITY_DN16711_c0_g2_i1:116-3121(+)